jgi:hypothetical protein
MGGQSRVRYGILETGFSPRQDSRPVTDPIKPAAYRFWMDEHVRFSDLDPLGHANNNAIVEAVSRGEFVLNGFRNRDLRQHLFGDVRSATTRRSQMTKITRMIRMLRAHGLVHKVSKTHRYTVSPKGRDIIAALLAARSANTQQLTQLAA